MNYRHAYHAGNFADVLKHATLAIVIEHLKLKPQPFRVIDTHAGIGLYDLAGDEAEKTGEWREGIGRIYGRPMPNDVAGVLKPYLAAIADLNAEMSEDGARALSRYPGSPTLASLLMRPEDQIIANEKHPEDCELLRDALHRDKRAKVLEIDGWQALKSLLPPKERRGVVLCDPPFEEPGEFLRLVDGMADGYKRFATGTFIFWYPIKDRRAVERLKRDVAALAIPKTLAVELLIKPIRTETELVGSGLIIVNPPYTLEAKLRILLPFLVKTLGRSQGASSALDWLTGERPAA